MLSLKQLLCLFVNAQTAGKNTLIVKTAFDGLHHLLPNRAEIFPKPVFVFVCIFPKRNISGLAIIRYIRKTAILIYRFFLCRYFVVKNDISAADTANFIFSEYLFSVKRNCTHCVRMRGLRYIVKDDLYGGGF